jgi:hypothetical protein
LSNTISRKFDPRLNLRHAARLFGERVIRGDPQLDATGEVRDGLGALQAEETRMLDGVESRSISTEDLTPFVENRDPWRVRIPRLGRNAWERMQRRWSRQLSFLAQVTSSEFPLRTRIEIFQSGRMLMPQEISELHEELDAKRLDDFHRAQAELGRMRIKNTLTRLGHCYAVEKDGHRVIRNEVHLPYVEYSPLYYRYGVEASTLPFRVSIMDIQGDAVCTDLSAACGHPVRSEIKKIENSVIGLQYTIEIAATMGVPNVCKFSDMLPLLPATAKPLTFLTGYSEGKRLRYADLEDMPHFLGGGQTKGGKSNMMHVIACTLISRNSPDALRLLMIDLKFNGIEMARYSGIPHLIAFHKDARPNEFCNMAPSGIATVPEQAINMLEWLVKESDRRGNMFTKDGVQNLRQWNHKHLKRRMPYIVIINDELAQLRLDPEYGKQSYELLQKILSMARAAGVSFITFTQSSNARIIDEFIKINLPGRVCFSVPDASSSILFVGNGMAQGLMPAGRAVYKHGTQIYLVQTPLIESKDVDEVVANAKLGKLTSHLKSRPVLPEEVIEWAVDHNQSSLATRDVFEKFGRELQRIDKHAIENLLNEMEGRDYRVGDHVYQVLSGIGNRPRTLKLLDSLLEMEAETQNSRDGARGTEESAERCAYCNRLIEDLDTVECDACGAPL